MVDSVPCGYHTQKKVTIGKSTHFNGQPLYSQVIKFLCKDRILQLSCEYGGERYVKRFDSWTHLVEMFYAVIMRFDSLREITASMQGEAHKLSHLSIAMMPSRSMLSDANSRRPDSVFEAIYRDLYAIYRERLSSDSRSGKELLRIKHLRIIDSTTITLFSNLIFKGVSRHPKNRQEERRYKGSYCHPTRASPRTFSSLPPPPMTRSCWIPQPWTRRTFWP